MRQQALRAGAQAPAEDRAPLTFWQALRSTYSGASAFLIACPLLALVPAVFEMIQHIVEVRIGLYESVAAAKALEYHPLRMGFGFLKVAALMIPQYWITRFLVSRDRDYAARMDRRAVRLFAGFLLFSLGLAAIQLFGLPPTPAVQLAALLVGQIVGCLIVAWGVAAALGNAAIGPLASLRLMLPRLPWTFLFLLAAMLPLMAAHYGLGALALLGPKALLWPGMIVDSLLVSGLIAVMAASFYYAALRAATQQGVTLTPGIGAA